jgi:HK97 family phage major capsid protein
MKKLLATLNLQLFAMIQHSDVDALIPEESIREIFQGIEKESQVFKLCQRLPNMSSNRTRIKVLDSLPMVYFQGSSTAFKKTTKQAWKDKYIYAEELAVIVAIAEADIDDAEYDIWGQVKPKIVEAISKKIDQVVLFGGEDKPVNFPDSILSVAFAKGFVREKGNSETIYNAISETMGLVEESGYSVNGLLAGPSIKKVFRGMVDTTGQLITGDEISALPRAIVENGAWDKSKATAVVGDFKQAVFAIRQDVTYKLLTEGVIQDPSDGSIVYNLAQQDMVALRVTFRFGWQLPNPVNRLAEDEEGRLPFAVVAPASSAKLTVSLTPGVATTFESTQVVKMAADVRGAKIYYTDNGSTPTSASTLYSAPITLSATKTIKAIAIKDGYSNSDVVSVTYTKE